MRFRRWIVLWAVAGLCVPAILLFRWFFSKIGFGQFEATVWPSSICLMVLEAPSTKMDIVEVYAIAILANVLLYSVVGLVTWPLLRIIAHRRRAA